MDERSPSPASSTWTDPSPTPAHAQPHPLPSIPHHHSNTSSHHQSSSSSPSSFPSQRQPQARRPSSQSHSSQSHPPLTSAQHSSSTSSNTTSSSSTSHSHKLPKFLRRDKDKDKRGGSADETADESRTGAADGRHERMTGLPGSSSSRPSHLSPPLESSSTFASGPSSYNSPPKKSKSKTLGRKGSKLFGSSSFSSSSDATPPIPPPKDDDQSLRRSVSPASISTTSSSVVYNTADPMIIVDPPPASFRRHLSSPASPSSRRSTSVNLSAQPLSSVSSTNPYSQTNGNGSTTRLGDGVASSIPTRLGGWLSNLLPGASSSSVSLNHPSTSQHTPIPPSLHQQRIFQQQQQHQSSVNSPPRPSHGQGQRSFVAAAKEKGAIMRYLLDSDAGKPERCEDGIWVMGILHEGWRPPVSRVGSPTSEKDETEVLSSPISPPRKQLLQRSGTSPASPGKFTNLFSSSTLSVSLGGKDYQDGSPKKDKKKEELRWPEEFFDDFRTSIWCTYRSHYAPITHLPPHLLVPSPSSYDADGLPLPSLVENSIEAMKRPPIARPTSGWAWVKGGGDDKGLSTDSGWGCMLRTGQSLLANSLVRLHLGRDWRRPSTPPSESTATAKEIEDYATYVQIISWFMDDPLPHAPFSVHRMALVGKQLGKEVGEWFGPSTAAGAIRSLTNGYSHAGLSVSLAADAVIFRSDVYAASQQPDSLEERKSKSSAKRWGGRAVLVLVGVRLGLDGVNPIYHESVKNLFTFPQSVGIAGGRPSSSYYFLGYQAESLFYLDPHHTRPAIVFRVPPTREELDAQEAQATAFNSTRDDDFEEEGVSFASESEVDTVLGAGVSPSILASPISSPRPPPSAQRRSSSLPRGAPLSPENVPLPQTPPVAFLTPTAPTIPLPAPPPSPRTKLAQAAPPPPSAPLDPMLEWYATAYPQQSLQTFHCEKVRKMAFSQLDPSMLVGFLCRDEAEWDDFCARVADMPNAIFSIADEPSSWDDDDDAGLESFSETDPDGLSSRSRHSSTNDLLDDDDDLIPSHSNLPTATSDPVVVPDEDLGVEVVLNSNKSSLDESGSSFQPTPSTATPRPIPSRALGSEFEIVEQDDWLQDDDDDDDARRPPFGLASGGMGSASIRNKSKKSSLPFPSPSKDLEEDEDEDDFGFGREGGGGGRARTMASGMGGRRKLGSRAVSGVTLKGRESGEDDF